jgi:hypothetical protein
MPLDLFADESPGHRLCHEVFREDIQRINDALRTENVPYKWLALEKGRLELPWCWATDSPLGAFQRCPAWMMDGAAGIGMEARDIETVAAVLGIPLLL